MIYVFLNYKFEFPRKQIPQYTTLSLDNILHILTRGRIWQIWAASKIWLVPLKIVLNVSRFKPALNWNRFLADMGHDSNSLNSDSSKLRYFYIIY